MNCPSCKTEYRTDLSRRCSHCDVPLVESLDSLESFSGTDGAGLAWRGNDPVIFSRVLGALRDHKIQSYQIAEHDQLSRFAAMRPSYEIFVRRDDVAPAEKVIREALESKASE